VRVEYMVTGWLPEHTGAARLHARQERVDADLAAEQSGRAAAGTPVEAGGSADESRDNGSGASPSAGEADG